FQAMNSDERVLALFDYVERMLEADGYLPPPPLLEALRFTASAWQPRPDGEPVDDYRPRRVASSKACPTPRAEENPEDAVDRLIADMEGAAAAPRRNGELVFDAPWQGRAFGMAIALNGRELYEWEEFRQALIAEIAPAGSSDEGFVYYEKWLAAFEPLLAD